tara:strand:+ start:218 stop:493 length:276 start_codon:yes stop_codon:yes gene_type:complete
MNNIEKKLDALIDALGFDVEVIDSGFTVVKVSELDTTPYPDKIHRTDYKLTKRNDPQRKYNLYMSALIEYKSGATTLEEFTEITKDCYEKI